MIMFLIQNGCQPMSKNICDNLISNNDLHTLKYVINKGCPLDKTDKKNCAIAASNNNYQMLKYLRQKGCEWDENVCLKSIRNNNDEMLKFAHY